MELLCVTRFCVSDGHSNSSTVRLENEHIGNTDQYRVTREVPLPYTREQDGDSDDEASVKSLASSLPSLNRVGSV